MQVGHRESLLSTLFVYGVPKRFHAIYNSVGDLFKKTSKQLFISIRIVNKSEREVPSFIFRIWAPIDSFVFHLYGFIYYGLVLLPTKHIGENSLGDSCSYN